MSSSLKMKANVEVMEPESKNERKQLEPDRIESRSIVSSREKDKNDPSLMAYHKFYAVVIFLYD
jgi:hypothetical protein